MEIITIHPKTQEEVSLFEQLAKVLNVPFEKQKTEIGYNPEFVAKMRESKAQAKAGKTVKISLDEIWK